MTILLYLFPSKPKFFHRLTLAVIVKNRNRMTTIEQNIKTCGLVTELTKSQNANFEIIQKH